MRDVKEAYEQGFILCLPYSMSFIMNNFFTTPLHYVQCLIYIKKDIWFIIINFYFLTKNFLAFGQWFSNDLFFAWRKSSSSIEENRVKIIELNKSGRENWEHSCNLLRILDALLSFCVIAYKKSTLWAHL